MQQPTSIQAGDLWHKLVYNASYFIVFPTNDSKKARNLKLSKLSKAVASGEFITTCELTPPKGINLDPLFAKAESLKNLVHAFNLTDSHAARMSTDPTAVGHLLLNRGIEPIVQMTTRDKNRIAIQAGMLGAAVLGIPNLVFMGGDPPKNGDHPDAKPVFDLFASQLLDIVRNFESGTDLAGNKLSGSPSFCIGAVVNPGSPRLDAEIENMHRKIDAGAAFLQTQAVFDTSQFAEFLSKTGAIEVPILAGVIPVKSVNMAQFMNQRVPGITVPDALMKRIADCGTDKQRIAATSVEVAADIVRDLKSMTRGVHMMAIGWEDKIPRILDLAAASASN